MATASCASPSDASCSEAPLAVVSKIDHALRLTAVDDKARLLGLGVGMPLADARAMLPHLKAVPADPPADQKLLEGIAAWCSRFTPYVAFDPPHGLLLDVTGVSHLFGGENRLLEDIGTLLFKQGFKVRTALAGTAASARALAAWRDGAVIAPGEDAKAVMPLPVEALRLDAATIHALRHAGLKTVGQVAARRRSELRARFGEGLLMTLDALLGHRQTPISPRLPLPALSVEHRFADPVVVEEAVLQVLWSLTAMLAERLAERGQGARRLKASFFRADGGVRQIAITTGDPTRDPGVISRLFREKLAALADPLDPGFGYDLVRLEVDHAERLDAQALQLQPAATDDKDLRLLIDRLSARFGPHRLVLFQPNDTHIPEAAFVMVPAQYAQGTKNAWRQIREAKEAPRRPLRMFAKPEPVDATAAPSGHPTQFFWRNVRHLVARSEGPERIAMEWWRHDRPLPTRDYFRIEDEEGRRYWLYRDGMTPHEAVRPRWFLQGLFA